MGRQHQPLQNAAPQHVPSDRALSPVRMLDVCYDIFSDQDLLAYLRAPSSSKLGAIAQSPTSSASAITRDPRGHHSAASSISSSPIASPSPRAIVDRSPFSPSPGLPFAPLSPLRYGYAACPTGVCYQPLIAANANLPDALRQMAAQGADLNICDHQGYTPLMRAIKQGCHGAVHTLLRLMRVSDIDLPGGIRDANIHRMAHTSKVCVPRQVLLDASEATVIANALHVAINEGSVDAVRALCERGVDVNQVSFMTLHRDGPPGRFQCCAHARPTSWALYGERARGSAVAIVEHLISRGSKSSHLILEIAQNAEALDDACRGVAAAVLAANPAADCALGRAMCVSMDRACAGDFPGCQALVRLMLAAGGAPAGVEGELGLVVRYALATGDAAVLRALLSPARCVRGGSPAVAQVTLTTPLEGTPLLAAVLRDGFEARGRPGGSPGAVGRVLEALLASASAADISRCVLWCPELLALAAGCGGDVLCQLLAACDVLARAPSCAMALMFALHTMRDESVAAPLACALVGLPPTTPPLPCAGRASADGAETSAMLLAAHRPRATASSCFQAAAVAFALAQIMQMFRPHCLPGGGRTGVPGEALAPESPCFGGRRTQLSRPLRKPLQLQLCGPAGASACSSAHSNKAPPCRVLSVLVVSMDLECSPRQAHTPPCETPPHAVMALGSAATCAAAASRGCAVEAAASAHGAIDLGHSLYAIGGGTAVSRSTVRPGAGEAAAATESHVATAVRSECPCTGLEDGETGHVQSAAASQAHVRRMCVLLSCVLKRASVAVTTPNRHHKRRAGVQPAGGQSGRRAFSRNDRAHADAAVLPSSSEQPCDVGCALTPELRELICARVLEVTVPTLRSMLRGSAAAAERGLVDGPSE